MGRPKGGKNRNWSKEEKLRIVRRYFDERIGQGTLAKEENISKGQLYNWIRKYAEGWHRMFDSPEEMIDTFVYYYNHYRPAYSLQYKTPVQYRTDRGFL